MKSTEVRFAGYEGVTLAGTFTTPDGPGPLAAVVCVHGSGNVDRDENPDSGVIAVPKNYSVGHVRQQLSFSESTSIGEACLGLPEEERAARVERILALQGEISLAANRAQIGRTLDVLIEEAPGNGAPARGRSVREAPEDRGRLRVAGFRHELREDLPSRVEHESQRLAIDLHPVRDLGVPDLAQGLDHPPPQASIRWLLTGAE